jgi:hypothetical protein
MGKPQLEVPKEGLNCWVPSTDPFEGRWVDVESEKDAAARCKALHDSVGTQYDTDGE